MELLGFPKASSAFIEVAFTFATATPLDFGTLNAGDEVVDVSVVVTTTFDDPAALLSLGLVSNPGCFLATNEVTPGAVGTYFAKTEAVTGSDRLRLQVLPGTSSQGSGRVVALVRRS